MVLADKHVTFGYIARLIPWTLEIPFRLYRQIVCSDACVRRFRPECSFMCLDNKDIKLILAFARLQVNAPHHAAQQGKLPTHSLVTSFA